MPTTTKHAITASAVLLTLTAGVLAGGLVSDPELIVSGRVTQVAAEDLNDDEYVDLAVGIGFDAVATLLNDGKGGFTLVSTVAAGRPEDVVLADVDLNSTIELIVLESDPPATRVYVQNGGVIGAVWNYSAPINPRTLAVTDAIGGLAPDLVIAGAEDIVVRMNAGDGTFPESFPGDAGVCRYRTIVPADLDADGDEDLVVSGGAPTFDFEHCGAIRIVERLPSGLRNHVTYLEDFDHQSTTVGDIDGDGDLDIMTAANGPFLIRYATLINNGVGIFSDGWTTDTLEFAPRKLDLVDLDGDGDLDAVGGLQAWINEDGAGDLGDGSVDLLQGADWPYGAVLDQAIADVDEDGDPDIVFAAADGLVVLRSLTSCIADFGGSGDVGFEDLTQLLSAWGPCAGCPEDLGGDDVVGFADLTALLSAWGPC